MGGAAAGGVASPGTAAATMTDHPVRAFVGLGSNLDDPLSQLQRAVNALEALDGIRLVQSSAFYRSRPMGPQDQPDFINAVVEIETALSPDALLDQLHAIEQAQGRVRERHWGPRTLDLDLLLYGDETIDSERLTVPHPGLPERAFVLYPLAELAPALVVPGRGRVDALAARLDRDGLERLAD